MLVSWKRARHEGGGFAARIPGPEGPGGSQAHCQDLISSS
ncbi:hypothetical protein MBELCI_1232 [Limimaricola cinnabarinus LL-001]|uniref:Uncharacterized protein n=1 Tax=Limimaricola cinnabarinus LL-001 TaxID=1337093 RepID=U2Z1E4_9RHOB|nr:hypothetical protein MBELCI_1232 [Limimaricola cinnabarinus LL-001]